jgi:hypothetical protein
LFCRWIGGECTIGNKAQRERRHPRLHRS